MELEQTTILLGMFALMLAGILVGVHIAFAFAVTALIGNILIFGDGDLQEGFNIAMSGLGKTHPLTRRMASSIPILTWSFSRLSLLATA